MDLIGKGVVTQGGLELTLLGERYSLFGSLLGVDKQLVSILEALGSASENQQRALTTLDQRFTESEIEKTRRLDGLQSSLDDKTKALWTAIHEIHEQTGDQLKELALQLRELEKKLTKLQAEAKVNFSRGRTMPLSSYASSRSRSGSPSHQPSKETVASERSQDVQVQVMNSEQLKMLEALVPRVEVLEKGLKDCPTKTCIQLNRDCRTRLEKCEQNNREAAEVSAQAVNDMKKLQGEVLEIEKSCREVVISRERDMYEFRGRLERAEEKLAGSFAYAESALSKAESAVNKVDVQHTTFTEKMTRTSNTLNDTMKDLSGFQQSTRQEFDKLKECFRTLGGVDKVRTDLEGFREIRKQAVRTETAAVAACAEAERALAISQEGTERHQREMAALRHNVDSLANLVQKVFGHDGASGTHKCLSCDETKSQAALKQVQGEDNKPYLAQEASVQVMLKNLRKQMQQTRDSFQEELGSPRPPSMKFTPVNMKAAPVQAGRWRPHIPSRPQSARGV